LLAFGLRATAIIAVTPAAAATATTPTTSTATFETAIALLLSRRFAIGIILIASLWLIARIAWLVIASVAILTLEATASATAAVPVTLITVAAVLSVAGFRLGLLRFGGFDAEQTFQPANETSGLGRLVGGATGSHITRLRRAGLKPLIATRFARLKGLLVARLKRFLFSRLSRLRVPAFRSEGGTLVGLRTRVLVVGAIAPTNGRTFGFSRWQDFDFGPFQSGRSHRLG
jgi:hypothetical protein